MFCCRPPAIAVFDLPGGDFTLSTTPIPEIGALLEQQYIAHVRFHEAVDDDGVPLVKLVTGTQIYAVAFGCEVHTFEDNNPCAKPRVFSAAQADALCEPRLEDCPNLMRIFELIDEMKRRLGSDLDFGPPDMQTGFDTAALIWDKTSFLCAMMDPAEKQAVRNLTAKCAHLFKSFVTRLREVTPTMSPCHCPGTWTPPELGPWVSNDECGNMSTALFEEFCLPELIDLAETFGGLGMHCCATAEHQFESFRKIPNFYGFNRVQSGAGYLPMLKPLGGPDGPVHVLAWVEEDTIRELLTHAPAGTRFIFNLLGAEEQDAREWLDHMRALAGQRPVC
jgi:hypothetical protein